MSGWQVHGSKELMSNPWFTVTQDEVETAQGKQYTYNVVRLKSISVFIVAIDKDDRVYLQKQYRYAVDEKLWEVPAGHSDGQNLQIAAERELMEETGFQAKNITQVGLLRTAAGIADLKQSVWLAEGLTAGEPTDKEEEITESNFFTFDELWSMVRSGELCHGDSIAAIAMVQTYIQNRSQA